MTEQLRRARSYLVVYLKSALQRSEYQDSMLYLALRLLRMKCF